MQFKQQFTVLGAKGFKGDIEGQKFDSTKLYVMMDCPDKGTELGFNASPLPFGKSDEFEKIKASNLSFPLVAELTVNATTKGFEVVAFSPIKKATVA